MINHDRVKALHITPERVRAVITEIDPQGISQKEMETIKCQSRKKYQNQKSL